MPRSLAELSLAMPATQLVPHPVVPSNFRTDALVAARPSPRDC